VGSPKVRLGVAQSMPVARGAGDREALVPLRQGFVLSGEGLGLIAEGHGQVSSCPLLAPIERIGPGVPENDNLVQELALVL
jgi:hypothetical protein